MKTKTRINSRFTALVTRARWQGDDLPVLSVSDVADRCGYSRSYIWLLMIGRRSPGALARPKIAKGLGVATARVEECFPPAKRKVQ